MITHIIYEIIGRKIGCCKSIEYRMKKYEESDGKRPVFIRIRERLNDKTDKEAGDIEWMWADRLGYKRGVHYTISINAIKVGSRKGGARLNEIITHEHRVEMGRKGGAKGGRIGGFRRAESLSAQKRSDIARNATAHLTPEQRSTNASKGTPRYMEISTPEQRSERARKGSLARWNKQNGGNLQ